MRRGRDLAAEGVAVVAMGGAQALARFLARYGGLRLAGLCDAREERVFRRALERAGVDASGFHVCVPDLEGELIRALGVERALALLDAQGHLRSFRTLQAQSAWQGRDVQDQLRRFLGSGGRRKLVYAPLLVRAIDADRIPRPLDAVLASV